MPLLRDGWTTGTTAAAAAYGALYFWVKGAVPTLADVPLPPLAAGSRIQVPVVGAGPAPGGLAWGMAKKFAGDDPDVTDGMVIEATLYPAASGIIAVEGGLGIGRVTLPGLAVPVGDAAINPAPRAQLEAVVREFLPTGGVQVVISAPEGEARAAHTMNGKLGIVGGISILGTHGIVKPFSHEAWMGSIDRFVAVQHAAGQDHVAFATGRRSLALLEKVLTHLPSQAFMVAGDFVADALARAGGFARISWGCFFGKLLKLAQGHGNTHAHASDLDMGFLAEATGRGELAAMPTAMSALDFMLEQCPENLAKIVGLAKANAEKMARTAVIVHLFHNDGRELASI